MGYLYSFTFKFDKKMKTERQIRQTEDSRFIIFVASIIFTFYCIWHFSSNIVLSIGLTWMVLMLLILMFFYGAGEQNKREDEAMRKFDEWYANNEIDNGIL